MQNFSLMERIIHNIKDKANPMFGWMRRRKLTNTDFTIISNNCWGGVCYEYFDLPKQSPTVGTYFYPDDYIKFISDLKYYTSLEIEMISSEQSKYRQELEKRGEKDVPIGRLDDVEIVFLHYKDPYIAKSKWERRCARINWKNIIVKFSFMNGCEDKHVYQFQKIHNIKKFMFVTKEYYDNSDCILFGELPKGVQILNDTFYFKRYINVIRFINSKITPYNIEKY